MLVVLLPFIAVGVANLIGWVLSMPDEETCGPPLMNNPDYWHGRSADELAELLAKTSSIEPDFGFEEMTVRGAIEVALERRQMLETRLLLDQRLAGYVDSHLSHDKPLEIVLKEQ